MGVWKIRGPQLMIPENIEIHRNGKTYFCNISLSPFHQFRHD